MVFSSKNLFSSSLHILISILRDVGIFSKSLKGGNKELEGNINSVVLNCNDVAGL